MNEGMFLHWRMKKGLNVVEELYGVTGEYAIDIVNGMIERMSFSDTTNMRISYEKEAVNHE